MTRSFEGGGSRAICRRCESSQCGWSKIWQIPVDEQKLYDLMELCINCGSNDKTASYSVVRNMMQNLRLSGWKLEDVKSISRDYRTVWHVDGRRLIDGLELPA